MHSLTCISYGDVPNYQNEVLRSVRTFQIMKMDKMKLSKWVMVLGAPGGINIPCLMQDTRLCPKMTDISHGTQKRFRYKTCHYVETGVHNLYVKSKEFFV